MRRGLTGGITPVLAGRWARNCKSLPRRLSADSSHSSMVCVTGRCQSTSVVAHLEVTEHDIQSVGEIRV
jgi:hypothetical protein